MATPIFMSCYSIKIFLSIFKTLHDNKYEFSSGNELKCFDRKRDSFTLKAVGLFLLFRFSYKQENGLKELKSTFLACWATIFAFGYLSLKNQTRRTENQILYFIFQISPEQAKDMRSPEFAIVSGTFILQIPGQYGERACFFKEQEHT